ncbi:MAG: SRPBCC domain-containing protein [Caldilineaceae bacterium]
MTQQINIATVINASPATVWDALTKPGLMKQWMVEPGMDIEILTDGRRYCTDFSGYHFGKG